MAWGPWQTNRKIIDRGGVVRELEMGEAMWSLRHLGSQRWFLVDFWFLWAQSYFLPSITSTHTHPLLGAGLSGSPILQVKMLQLKTDKLRTILNGSLQFWTPFYLSKGFWAVWSVSSCSGVREKHSFFENGKLLIVLKHAFLCQLLEQDKQPPPPRLPAIWPATTCSVLPWVVFSLARQLQQHLGCKNILNFSKHRSRAV